MLTMCNYSPCPQYSKKKKSNGGSYSLEVVGATMESFLKKENQRAIWMMGDPRRKIGLGAICLGSGGGQLT